MGNHSSYNHYKKKKPHKYHFFHSSWGVFIGIKCLVVLFLVWCLNSKQISCNFAVLMSNCCDSICLFVFVFLYRNCGNRQTHPLQVISFICKFPLCMSLSFKLIAFWSELKFKVQNHQTLDPSIMDLRYVTEALLDHLTHVLAALSEKDCLLCLMYNSNVLPVFITGR